MRHFSSEEWADYVRNALNTKDKEAMDLHLANGCGRCAASLEAWRRISETAALEGSYEAPAVAVTQAKSLMALNRRPSHKLMPKLLFDSSAALAVVGVRSASTTPRQLLYGVDDYRVDLRFEPNFNEDKVALIGQVLTAGDQENRVGRLQIALKRAGKALGSAQTNEFGEFQFDCDLGGRLELEVRLPRGEVMSFPILEPSDKVIADAVSDVIENNRLNKKRKAKVKSTRK